MKLPRLSHAEAIVLALVATFVTAVAVIAMSLNIDRRNAAMETSEAQAQRFVNGAEAAINRSLLGVDVLLSSADDLLGLSELLPDWVDGAAASHLMQKALRQNLLVSRVVLLGEDGRVLASSNLPEVGRASDIPSRFIADVLAQPLSTLVIGGPFTSFRSAEQVLYMGRHVMLADGSRIVVAADVAVAQLRNILIQGADIAGLQATLERGNGELLVEAPAQIELLGRMLTPPLESLGPILSTRDKTARLDQTPAIVVVRNTLYNQLYVTASIPNTAVLQDSRRESWLINGVALALALTILAAGGFAVWHFNRISNAQAELRKAKETLDQALESMVSGFVLLDPQQRVLNWNRRFAELHPWLHDKLKLQVPFLTLVQTMAGVLMPDATEDERAQWVEHRMGLLKGPYESHQHTTPNGTILEIVERPTPDGGTVITYQDVTRLRQATADVELLAFYDPLTGLPNRRLLNDRLQQGILATLRTGRHGALLFLDLDNFKNLNDTAGHDTGDLLLQQVAQRLKACVREEDTVARLGGDEFVVMLQSLSPEPLEAAAQAKKVCETILGSLTQPYTLNDTPYTSTCSVGATLFGKTHQEAADLLKQADIAMYQVKNSGRNAMCFFDPYMLTNITAKADLERALRQALERNQLVLHFQVQVAAHGRPIGAEVLIRWQHPERGMVPPGQFIGLAEETGLILPIGEWVLRTACQQLKRWETTPHAATLQLAVNVSARQFRAADFVNQVQRIVLETGVQPHLLKLELTESLVLDNINETVEKMQQLKAMGVRFSMDDFGTGYSSLAYLTRLPLDQLKIDQSFVRNIGLQASDSAVIDTIIGLGRSLGLEVIAEGVETAEQRDFLAEHGCERCQGYLFGKPMAIEAFESALMAQHDASFAAGPVAY
jgi:diguanylate cyclase (GGDEF)-like protein